MSGRRRYDRILSSTALALILVAPLSAGAQDANRNASKQNGEIAVASSEGYSSEAESCSSFSCDHESGAQRRPGLRGAPGRSRPRAAIRSICFA